MNYDTNHPITLHIRRRLYRANVIATFTRWQQEAAAAVLAAAKPKRVRKPKIASGRI